jgi:uncharacterized protein YbaR (Trm112 family)
MIAKELLDILVCPENKTSVTAIDDELIAKINSAIGNGSVKNRGGEAVSDPIDGGLLREDGAYVYPIRDDIPIMLVDEALEMAAFN